MSKITDESDKYLKICGTAEPMLLFHSNTRINADRFLASENQKIDSAEPKVKSDEYKKYNIGKCVFVFYGIPSYKVPVSLADALPVCFVLKRIYKPMKAYPFDTGAFLLGMYNGFLNNSEFNLSDLRLNSDYEYISGFISLFFADKENYRNGKAKKINFTENILQAYNAIINEKIQADQRKCTMELVFDTYIELKKYIAGIVIPEEAKEDDNIEAAVKELNLENNVSYYKFNRKICEPMEYFNSMRSCAIELAKGIEERTADL